MSKFSFLIEQAKQHIYTNSFAFYKRFIGFGHPSNLLTNPKVHFKRPNLIFAITLPQSRHIQGIIYLTMQVTMQVFHS